MPPTSSAPAASNGEGAKVLAGGRDNDKPTRAPRHCPPYCATACAVAPGWHRALLDDRVADPATRTFWAISGLWGDAPAHEVVQVAAATFGARVVADALEMAVRWPSVVPVAPSRLAALAVAWRAEAVTADE